MFLFFFIAAAVLGVLFFFFFGGARKESLARKRFALATSGAPIDATIELSIDDSVAVPSPEVLQLIDGLKERSFESTGSYKSPHLGSTSLTILRSDRLRAVALVYFNAADRTLHYELIGETVDGQLLRLSVNPLADEIGKQEGVMQFGLKKSPPDVATAAFARRAKEVELQPLPDDLVKWVQNCLHRLYRMS